MFQLRFVMDKQLPSAPFGGCAARHCAASFEAQRLFSLRQPLRAPRRIPGIVDGTLRLHHKARCSARMIHLKFLSRGPDRGRYEKVFVFLALGSSVCFFWF